MRFLIEEAVASINETPTRTLFGLTPFQWEFAKLPLIFDPPENRETAELTSLRTHTTPESYEIRLEARAAYEKLKKDANYLASLAKIDEASRQKHIPVTQLIFPQSIRKTVRKVHKVETSADTAKPSGQKLEDKYELKPIIIGAGACGSIAQP
eukprot:g20499.t1